MKTIIYNILNGTVRISEMAVEAGDSGNVALAVENVPYEWNDVNVNVYALFSQGNYTEMRLINRDGNTLTYAEVPTEVMAENKAFKVCVFSVGSDNSERYAYRYATSPLWVNVGDGLGLDASVLPDKQGMDAVSTLLQTLSIDKKKLAGIEEGAEVNVQSDWSETNEDSDSFIKNKPTIDQSYNSNSENAQSGKAVREAISGVVNGSPEALDTLYELATALGNDENFATTVMTEIGKKTDYNEFLYKTTSLQFDIEALQNYGAGNGFENITVKGSYTSFKDFIGGIGTPGAAIKLKSDNADSVGFLFQSYNENQSEIDGFSGTTKFLIDMDGRMYKRRYSRFPGEPEHDWEEIVTGSDIVRSIESSLDEIIKKYGLDGEAV